jgi:hypothetical protein
MIVKSHKSMIKTNGSIHMIPLKIINFNHMKYSYNTQKANNQGFSY